MLHKQRSSLRNQERTFLRKDAEVEISRIYWGHVSGKKFGQKELSRKTPEAGKI